MKRILSFALGLALCASAAFGQYNTMTINTNSGAVRPNTVAWNLGGSNSIMNVVTGEFDVICLAGTCYTNWDQVSGATVTPGTMYLEFKYNATNFWDGGTLYAMAWANEEMWGRPIFQTNWSVAHLMDDPVKTVQTREAFLSNTWWFAWMDSDGDGIFNLHNQYYKMAPWMHEFGSEAAAVAEHMPHYITAITQVTTAQFWMVDWKACTPRYGWKDMNRVLTVMVTINLGIAGAVTWASGTNYNRNLWNETDWYYRDIFNASKAGATQVSGWAVTNLDFSYLTYIGKAIGGTYVSNFVYCINYNASAVSTPAASTQLYPINGETVTTQNVEFRFRNNYDEYPGILLLVKPFTSGSSSYTHYYYGYMENEHDDDGIVRHLMRRTHRGWNRSGDVASGKANNMIAGSNYYWQVQLLAPRLGSHWPAATASAWQVFKYVP